MEGSKRPLHPGRGERRRWVFFPTVTHAASGDRIRVGYEVIEGGEGNCEWKFR